MGAWYFTARPSVGQEGCCWVSRCCAAHHDDHVTSSHTRRQASPPARRTRGRTQRLALSSGAGPGNAAGLQVHQSKSPKSGQSQTPPTKPSPSRWNPDPPRPPRGQRVCAHLQVSLWVVALQGLEGSGVHLHRLGVEDHLDGHEFREDPLWRGPCGVSTPRGAGQVLWGRHPARGSQGLFRLCLN